jgi:hypothetical protein
MKIEVLEQSASDRLARTTLEQYVVGQHDGRFWRQDSHDVLQEVQLLVRCGDEEVLPVVVLALAVDLAIVADDAVALFLAEGWIGENDFVGLAASAQERVLGLDN